MTTIASPTDLEAVLRRFIGASATGDGETVAALVTSEVSGWSPTLSVSSRDELIDAFKERIGAGALEGVELEASSVAVIGGRAAGEWGMSAFFRGEFEMDGVRIRPRGRPVVLAGAT